MSVVREVARRKWPRRAGRAWRMLRGDAIMYGMMIDNGTVVPPLDRRVLVESCQFIGAPVAMDASKGWVLRRSEP